MAVAGVNGAAAQPLIEVQDLVKHFPVKTGLIGGLTGAQAAVHAVNGVSFNVRPGEVLGLAGESGCGKTTTAKLLLKLYEPTSGTIRVDGQDISRLRGAELKTFRRRTQLMFQNPYEAFSPRFTILRAVSEPLIIHGISSVSEREERVRKALDDVQLRPAESFFAKHPHQLSGGQLQRVALARAMVLEPDILIADEPVSMLDVSVRADILNQLLDLRQEEGMGIVFITHDLAVARYIADRIFVMYLGMFVEVGPAEEIIANPRHPYSRALLSNTLPAGDEERHLAPMTIGGEVPTPIDIRPGCRFANRCPFVFERCRVETPLLQPHNGPTEVACHLYDGAP